LPTRDRFISGSTPEECQCDEQPQYRLMNSHLSPPPACWPEPAFTSSR
jgi:hypothetical protein